MSLIELANVEKLYGSLRALKSMSLTLEPGRIGLLGPNGAGKSTLLKLLLGLLAPTAGSVRVFGEDATRNPFHVRARVGYMPEGDAVLPELNALEYTTLAAELCGLPRAEAVGRAHQVLHYVGLGEARYRRLATYSTGMRQRARLAQALVGDPKLLLLDEPTSGLDPRGRDEMLSLILDIPKRTGASIMLSTHILPDVEKTCDQVVVVAGGELLYAGALDAMLATDARIFEVQTKGDPSKLRTALELRGAIITERNGILSARLPEGRGANFVLEVAREAQVQLRHVAPLRQTLERAFLETLDASTQAASESAS